MTKKQLDIEIGCEVLRIDIAERDQRLFDVIRKSLKAYLTTSKKKGSLVRVVPYFDNHLFNWPQSELAKFRNFFRSVQQRFPPTHQLDETVDLSLNILQHYDTDDKSIRYLCACLESPRNLIYLMVGFDVYLYDVSSNTAFFFLKGHARPSHMLMGVMNGIMFVLSYRLIHGKGLLLHGAAIQKNDQTVLFLGLSGAGKSTITRLCDPDICFADDGVVVKHEKNLFYTYRSPFCQTKEKNNHADVAKGKIKKIFLLEKSDRYDVLPIAKNELMRITLMHLIHFYKYLNQETARLGFYEVKKLLETLPSYRLQFAKSGKIWHNIVQV
jgi:hypothetical protein